MKTATSAAPGAPPSASERMASEPDLGRTLKVSIVLHLLLILAVAVKSLVFPGKPITYIPTLRVDLVGLPDVLKKDRANLSKAPAPADLSKALKEAESIAKTLKPPPSKATEQAAPDEMVLKPKQQTTRGSAKDRQKKLKNALDRIKALQKISADDDGAPANVIKGNKVSKGTSLSGDAREAAEASYFDLVRDRLQDNWALPVWIARQNLAAQVQIRIDRRGQVRGLQFTKPSGNPQFDEAVKKTIAQSQPFPPPPEALEQGLLTDGILVGFPL